MRYTFQKWRETLPNVLTSSQAIYLAKIDSATGLVTSQSMTQKCLPNVSSSFVIIFVWTGSSLVHWWSCTHWCCGDITHWCCRVVISLHQSVTSIILLDAIWFKIGISVDQRYTHELASELWLPICCLLLEMYAIPGCDPVSSFSDIWKIATFQWDSLRWYKL